MVYPDERLNNPKLQCWLFKKGWHISPPYAQWNYWHIITRDGGVLPLSVEKLLSDYSATN